MYENVKKYGIYYLLKAYYNWKINQSQDFWILIAGTEGSGKSSLAVHYAHILDKNYLTDIKRRIIMSEEDIDELQELLKERAEYIKKNGKNPGPLVIHIDEGQLLWQSKDAMTRRNKQLEKILQTVRYLNICWIICTPSIKNMSKELIRRLDWLVIAEKDMHYIWLRDLEEYLGRLYYLEEKLYSGSNIVIQPKSFFIEKTFNLPPDIEAKTPYYRDIYNKYHPIKVSKTAEFLNNIKILNEKKKEKEKEEKKIEFNVEIRHGGDGSIDTVVDGIAYMNNYYRYKDLAKIIKTYSFYTLKNKLPDYDIRRKTQGKTIFCHLGDVIKVLGGNNK